MNDRGLKRTRLIVSDACRGLVEVVAEVFPNTDWRRCIHFYRNLFSHVPNGKVAEVAWMLKEIHAQESLKMAQAKATEVVARLVEGNEVANRAGLVERKVSETMTYYAYQSTHWRRLRTNNPLGPIIREVRRRTLGSPK